MRRVKVPNKSLEGTFSPLPASRFTPKTLLNSGVIGSLFTLRFSRQIQDNDLHDKLVPGFLAAWIYDESSYNPNRHRDDNDLKTLHGISTFDHGSRKK